jgi:hypothetical protein
MEDVHVISDGQQWITMQSLKAGAAGCKIGFLSPVVAVVVTLVAVDKGKGQCKDLPRVLRGVAVDVLAELLQKGHSFDRVGFEEQPPPFYSEIAAAAAEVAAARRSVVVVEASRIVEIVAADVVVAAAAPPVHDTNLGNMAQRPAQDFAGGIAAACERREVALLLAPMVQAAIAHRPGAESNFPLQCDDPVVEAAANSAFLLLQLPQPAGGLLRLQHLLWCDEHVLVEPLIFRVHYIVAGWAHVETGEHLCKAQLCEAKP